MSKFITLLVKIFYSEEAFKYYNVLLNIKYSSYIGYKCFFFFKIKYDNYGILFNFTDAISNINFKINVHVFAFLFYHFVKLFVIL